MKLLDDEYSENHFEKYKKTIFYNIVTKGIELGSFTALLGLVGYYIFLLISTNFLGMAIATGVITLVLGVYLYRIAEVFFQYIRDWRAKKLIEFNAKVYKKYISRKFCYVTVINEEEEYREYSVAKKYYRNIAKEDNVVVYLTMHSKKCIAVTKI